MIPKNSGKNKDEILKNRFTSYLSTSAQHRRIDYIRELESQITICDLLDTAFYPQSFDLERAALKDVPVLITLENEALLTALLELSEKERYVFLKRVIDDASLEELAEILGISYKGAAAAYYRVIRKLKSKMRGV